ncbi:MAG: transcriptional regulator [Proteobacteria bacterium]|nr:MAG: transcriptional regulator [Pseudomonadota bacterium]
MQNRIEEQVLVELRRIIRATHLSAKHLARATGLTTSQLLVMQLLKSQKELSPRQIADAMNLTQATVTTLLDRLQERDLIDRRRSESDRRKMRVKLTPAGEAQLRQAPRSLQERFLEHFAELERWEQTAILSALQRVAYLLDAASLDAAAVLDVGQLDRPAE